MIPPRPHVAPAPPRDREATPDGFNPTDAQITDAAWRMAVETFRRVHGKGRRRAPRKFNVD